MVKQLVTLSDAELEAAYAERTLVLCKPDSIRLGIHGEIITRISRLYYKTVLARMFQFTEQSVQDFYAPVIDMWEPRDKMIEIFRKMTLAPSLALIVEGPNARLAMRKMAGGLATYKLDDSKVKFSGFKAQFEPLNAPMGTFRGDHSALDIPVPDTELMPVPNFIHATEDEADYQRELDVLTRHQHLAEADFFTYSKPEWEVIYGEGRGT